MIRTIQAGVSAHGQMLGEAQFGVTVNSLSV